MADKSVTITTKRRGRRKKCDRPKLDFVESPHENYTHVEHPDFGEPIEFPITEGQASQWISPQIKKLNQSFTPKRSRMGRSNKNKTNKLVAKDRTLNEMSTIGEYNDEDSVLLPNRMRTRRSSRIMSRTPERKNKENSDVIVNGGENNDNDDSPMPPSCLSTPDFTECKEKTFTSLRKSSMHFLFQAQTPVTRQCIVLVENTPI